MVMTHNISYSLKNGVLGEKKQLIAPSFEIVGEIINYFDTNPDHKDLLL